MNYLIGIDGGATKTRCVLTDFQLNVIHECCGGPSNFLIKGTKQVSNSIFDLLEDCMKNLVIDYSDIAAVVLGTAGAGREDHAEKMKLEILTTAEERGIKFNSFCVTSDARIALEGAFSGRAGCTLICGTGSIIYGIDEMGKVHRVGGYGRSIGDEGSGYSIGRKGLKAAAKSYDGRCLNTNLIKLLNTEFGIANQDSLIRKVYSDDFDIPAVAPLVIKGAEDNDETCLNILEEESEELILHVRAMTAKLKVVQLHLCLIGSIIENENYYSKLFKNKLKKAFPDVIIKKPEHSPEYGAAILAKKKFCK